MAPVTRSQKKKEQEDQFMLVSRERDELKAERDSAQDLAAQYKAQLDEVKIANAKLLQQNRSMASQIKALTEQLHFAQQVPKHINLLPAVPLRAIFSKLSPHDVLQMGRVCPAWKLYQRDIVTKVRSLSLLIGKPLGHSRLYLSVNDFFDNRNLTRLLNTDGTSMYHFTDKWFKVRYLTFRSDTVRFLFNTLPNIASLRIIINETTFEVLDHVTELIQKWSPKLVTFKLLCNFSEEDSILLSTKVAQLMNSINSLTELKNLNVHFDHDLYPEDGPILLPPIELPFLLRLRQFSYFSRDSLNLSPALYAVNDFAANNPELALIQFGNFEDDESLSSFADQWPIVASRINSLFCAVDFEFDEQDPPAVLPVLTRFTSLTKLTVFPNHETLKFSYLINSLSSLKQLVRLDLFFKLAELRSHLGPFSGDDNIAQSQIQQLKSVKMLSLLVDGNTHTDLESAHWAWAFPAVQILQMLINPENEDLPRVHQMVETFLQCPKLLTIFTIIYENENWPEWVEWTVVADAAGRKSIQQTGQPRVTR